MKIIPLHLAIIMVQITTMVDPIIGTETTTQATKMTPGAGVRARLIRKGKGVETKVKTLLTNNIKPFPLHMPPVTQTKTTKKKNPKVLANRTL